MKARRKVTIHLRKDVHLSHGWPWEVSSPDKTKRQRFYGEDDDYVTRMSKPSVPLITRVLVRCFA